MILGRPIKTNISLLFLILLNEKYFIHYLDILF